MNKRVIIFLFSIILANTGGAQCPSYAVLWSNLQKISGIQPEIAQQPQLEKWFQKWEKCQYPLDSTYTDALQELALVYYYKKEISQAITISKRAIVLNTKKQLNLRLADLPKTYYRLGVYYNATGQWQLAIEALDNATKTGAQLKSARKWVSNAHLYLIFVHFTQGDYEQAIYHSNIGEQMALEDKDEITLSKILHQKAQALEELGKLNEAVTILQKSLKIIHKYPEQIYSQAIQHRLLGGLLEKLNDPKSGLKELLLAYEIAKKKPQNLSDFPNAIGLYYYDTKNYPKAIEYYNEAIQIDNSLFNKSNLYNHIGKTYVRLKDYPTALSQFQKGLSMLSSSFQPTNISDLPAAKTIQISAQKRYCYSLIQDKADTWLDYSKTPIGGKGALQNALKTYALADSMIDFMRYEHVGEGSKLFWRQKTRGMYERAIEACYLAGDTEAAFRFFEKSKAVLLADKLNELGANQQLTETSTKRQRSLRDSIANLQNQLASLPANDAKRGAIQRRLELFNDDFEAFRKQLESTNPAYYRYKYDNSTVTTAEFQQSSLGMGASQGERAFISYFVGDSAIYAFCLDKKARLVRLSLHPAQYQTLANEFLSLCADRSRLNAHYPQYCALAHRLYTLLWKPLGITASRVIVSQDGVFLPFETLLVQPNQNDFLLKHHAISYTYSANFLAKNHTDLAPSSRQGDKLFYHSFVGFAPETFQPSLRQPSLKGSVAALEEVGKKFWWGKLRKSTEATKAQFMHDAPNARVIQLFTHADADSTDAVEPRVYFHDAALRLSELTQADRFAAQLLVLSACKTGVGQNQRGEGVFSLARGFAALGIPSTITTLWSVEDQPTYELTKLFYHYLDQGLPKDEALQKAKLDWLEKGGTADALPSQWAGMILVGDTTPLAMDGLQFIVLGLGILGLGVLGGIWWWRKQK
ncbi:CHAT domain-containing protein [Runella limosa]|uniref:CHAT domain-containing protein n=1 Tax=Runella limosa TaxID=370978 RepID=UPI00042550B2|nr:CHAT domain-containing tetratricopeptide repeat protein [Runella limosa]